MMGAWWEQNSEDEQDFNHLGDEASGGKVKISARIHATLLILLCSMAPWRVEARSHATLNLRPVLEVSIF